MKRSRKPVTPVSGEVARAVTISRGLPPEIRDAVPAGQRLRLPMREGCRSLNLSNTVAVAVYEAWRQQGFAQ